MDPTAALGRSGPAAQRVFGVALELWDHVILAVCNIEVQKSGNPSQAAKCRLVHLPSEVLSGCLVLYDTDKFCVSPSLGETIRGRVGAGAASK